MKIKKDVQLSEIMIYLRYFLFFVLVFGVQAYGKSSQEENASQNKINNIDLNSLSPEQKQILANWLIKQTPSDTEESSFTPSEEEPRYLLQVNTSQQMIVLDDGSKWQFHSQDTATIQRWILKDEIRVIAKQSGDYPFALQNTQTKTLALVRPTPVPDRNVYRDPNVNNYGGSAYRKNTWVSSVASQGRILTLEDGSVWDISPDDQEFVSKWASGQKVRVRKGGNGRYPFKITNYKYGRDVLANLSKERNYTPNKKLTPRVTPRRGNNADVLEANDSNNLLEEGPLETIYDFPELVD
jgi:hypothetical protein